MHVIIYEAYTASGGIALPGSPPATVPISGSGFPARVKMNVTAGLNIRTSIDTSSTRNIIISVPAGALLDVTNADDYAKIGGVNQWVRARDSHGHEGFAAAWYLEKAQTAAPVVEPAPVPTAKEEAPAPKPKPASPSELVVLVASRVGKFGVKVYQAESVNANVLSTEKVRAKLFVIEDAGRAKKKIGKAGKWLYVQTREGIKGFVKAELVSLP